MSYSNRLRKFNNSTSNQERLSKGMLLLEEVEQLGYPAKDLCDYLLVLAISEVPSDLAIAKWERAFTEFSNSATDADRLRWGQSLVRAGSAIGKDVSTIRLYLSELTYVNTYTNSAATVAELEADLYTAEDQEWAAAHSWDVNENKLFRRWAWELNGKARDKSGRTVAIKRRARRAAKYN